MQGAPASRLLFALVRAGTEMDPGTHAVLEALSAVAATYSKAVASAKNVTPVPVP